MHFPDITSSFHSSSNMQVSAFEALALDRAKGQLHHKIPLRKGNKNNRRNQHYQGHSSYPAPVQREFVGKIEQADREGL